MLPPAVPGTREFAADFELVDGALPPSSLGADEKSQDFGWMHYDIDFQEQQKAPRFFRARMQDGIIDVARARAEGLVR